MSSLSLFAGPEPVSVGPLPAGAETLLLPGWTIALSALLLVVVGLWVYHLCTQMGAARRYSWLDHQTAARRAEGLLREHVSDSHYQHLRSNGYLEVPSRLHPGRTYRIPSRPGRVTVWEGGRPVGQLCVIACDPVPSADLILTHKWLIEADERAYLALANWINGPPPRYAMGGFEPRVEQPR